MLVELSTMAEIEASYDVMNELRSALSLDEFKLKVEACQERGGYRLFAWQIDNELTACCGVMPMPTLYYTDCLWVADLVVLEKLRGRGIGRHLLKGVEEWARAEGYQEVALSSGVHRQAAHRFYQEKAAYELVSYQFQKKL